jgi:hypothetical protein
MPASWAARLRGPYPEPVNELRIAAAVLREGNEAAAGAVCAHGGGRRGTVADDAAA